MAKMTLLEMVQNILTAMKSDEVNSIHDTIESIAVADIVKETYFHLLSHLELPEKVGYLKIDGLGDTTRPAVMQLPTNLVSLKWLKYKNSTTGLYTDLDYVDEEYFFNLLLQNKATTDDVASVTLTSGLIYYVKDNKHPEFYTITHDDLLLFDSYDSAVDTTLQASKTFGWGETEETWSETDGFIPDLDSNIFPLLLSEAKSVAFVNLKEQANQKEEQKARKSRVHLQYKKWRDKQQKNRVFEGSVDYARKR